MSSATQTCCRLQIDGQKIPLIYLGFGTERYWFVHGGETLWKFYGSVSGGCVENAVVVAAQHAIETKCSSLIEFGVSDEDVITIGLACGGQIQILIEPSTCDHGHWVSQTFDRIEKREQSTLVRVLNLGRESVNSVADKRWLTARDSDYGAETGFNQSGEVFQTFGAKSHHNWRFT